MSDVKLFSTSNQTVRELEGRSVAVERSLQTLLERHLVDFLGVRFIASEHDTGPVHGGRIDTLGLDENGCPVIIEYKRALNENVMSQGLYYLDWLLDHQGDFFRLVLQALGQEQADGIDWSAPRLICIAGDFTKFDEYAVKQINRNIDLLRYRRFGEELLLLELVNSTSAAAAPSQQSPKAMAGTTGDKSFAEQLAQSSPAITDRYEALKAYLLALGDDVTSRTGKLYEAFRRIRNFACVELHPANGLLRVLVKVNPDEVTLEEGFTRDVREIGHWGTGDLEIAVRSDDDLERAKPLLLRSYEGG